MDDAPSSQGNHRERNERRVLTRLAHLPYVHVGLVVLGLLLSLAIPALLPLRWLTGAALVLFLPGYAWISALFVGDEPSPGWYLTLSLGLSISSTVLCGLLLNLTPWGLTTATWLIALAALALTGALVTAARDARRDAARDDRRMDGPSGAPQPYRVYRALTKRVSLTKGQMFLLVATLALVALAGVVAVVGAEMVPQSEQVIQFWMVPASATGPRTTTAQLGVREIGPVPSVEYDVIVRADGAEFLKLGPFSVKPGTDWKATIDIGSLPANTVVEADLYRTDAPNHVYRSAWIWTTR